MDVLSMDKLYLAVLFIVPGFIGMKFYSILVAGDKLDASKAVVDAVAFSCLNYAIFSWAIFWAQASQLKVEHPVAYAVFWFVVLFVGPLLCSAALVCLRRSRWLSRWLPHPTGKAWDHIFGTRECFYVIITLKSGKRFGGTYGSESFASSYPYEEQIYVEETWDVDDEEGFVRRHFNSRGMFVVGANIESIEFIEPSNEPERPEETGCAGIRPGRVSTAGEGVSTA